MRRVGVIGLGYVGLPLAVAFAREGCEVIALDVDSRKVAALGEGRSYIEDVADEELRAVAEQLHPTTRYAELAKADAVLMCLPTPLTANREPDLGPLTEATRALSEVLQAGQLVVLESTTYPGTTRERIAPLLEESGLAVGRDFQLAFSPERVDPGREDFTLRNTPKVLGGLTPACTERAKELYEIVCDDVRVVSSPEAAELTKLLENIFRSVNIALVNELAMLTDRMGIDIWEVVDAAATKPYGFMRFEPGPGMGGHCLPVDPFYLSWRAREFDVSTEFIELAGKINQQMPYHCVAKAQRALNDHGMPVKGARVAVFGVSYKPGVGDVRESPALKIISLLRGLGAEVFYHDPHVPELGELGLRSVPIEQALADADLAVIVTAHPEVDHELIATRARLTVDLRGVTRGTGAPGQCCCEPRPGGWRRAPGAAARRGGPAGRRRQLRRLRGRPRRDRDRRRLRDRRPRRGRQAPDAGPPLLGPRGGRRPGPRPGRERRHRSGRVRRQQRRRGRHPRGSELRARAQLDRAGQRDRTRQRDRQRRRRRSQGAGAEQRLPDGLHGRRGRRVRRARRQRRPTTTRWAGTPTTSRCGARCCGEPAGWAAAPC